jgi:hypothetical protein
MGWYLFTASKFQKKEQNTRRMKQTYNVNSVKVWHYGDKNSPQFDEEKYEIAKFAVLEVSRGYMLTTYL